jgi:hypothetical protein
MLVRRILVPATALLIMAAVVSPNPAKAAISAAATYSSTNYTSGTPHTTLGYSIRQQVGGTVAYVALAAPAGATASGPRAYAPALGASTVTFAGGSFVVRPAKPRSIGAGTGLLVAVSGVTTPRAGSYNARIRVVSTSGRTLASGVTPYRTFSNAVSCPSAWPTTYVATENARAGTTAWRISKYSLGTLAAYASKPSARCGEVVTFRVKDLSFRRARVEAFRMGYYGGAGARRVWAANGYPLVWNQPAPLFTRTDSAGRTINMVSARNWSPTFTVRIDGRFPPGLYLFRITDTSGYGTFVPLTVRDDGGTHKYLALNGMATWHTYNAYGGYSGYTAPAGQTPSRRISYDRPQVRNQGTGDYLSLEYGWTYWAEKQRLDLTYAADIDLHARPALLDRVRVLVLLAHTEYWSVPMRLAVDEAVASRLHLISLGANNIYWQIKPGDSPLTGPVREHEIFRTGDTGTFRSNGNPEQSLFGEMYGCYGADGTTRPNGGWLWQGVTATALPHAVHGENDEIKENYPVPAGTRALTTTPLLACKNPAANQLVAQSVSVDDGTGGKVFDAGSQSWICMLVARCPWGTWTATSTSAIAIGQAVRNVLAWVDRGTTTAPATSATDLVRAPTSPRDRLQAHVEQAPGPVTPRSGLPKLDPPPTQ